MKDYLIGISIICQLCLVANYVHEAIQARSDMRERILASIKALVCGFIAVLLAIGLIKFGFSQSAT